MSNDQRSSSFLAVRFALAAIIVGVFFGLSTVGTGAQRASITERDGVRKSEAMSREQAQLVSTSIVINEVYGGAGCGTAGCSTYGNDYIELKNISGTAVNISGWSVQYKSATGITTTYAVTPLTGAIAAGDTYLVAEGAGNAGTGVNAIPTPNATGSLLLSATAGKVALVNTSTPLDATTCPPTAAGSVVIDFVGYGATASCFEGGAAAPAPSTTTSDQRSPAGVDTDQNGVDFTAIAPTPQAAATPTAANVSVSGRVSTAEGRGITNVRVTVTGNSLPEPIVFITGRFGTYSIPGLEAGQTYVITVGNRRYSFAEPSRVMNLTDNATGVDFVAN